MSICDNKTNHFAGRIFVSCCSLGQCPQPHTKGGKNMSRTEIYRRDIETLAKDGLPLPTLKILISIIPEEHADKKTLFEKAEEIHNECAELRGC